MSTRPRSTPAPANLPARVRPSVPTPVRFLLLLAGIFALLEGMWLGLLRLGWDLPPLFPALVTSHGPLMVSGFLGTLISLERAVALGRRWAFTGPLLSGLGALVLLAGQPPWWGALLMTAGSLVLVAIFRAILGLQSALHTRVLLAGAAVWAGGNLLWLTGAPVATAVPWWGGFLILTIAGERLELSRLLALGRGARAAFVASAGVLVVGMLVAIAAYAPGMRLVGIGMAALALWLGRFDIARRTVRQQGLTRYIAVCLLTGYVWLGVAGLLAVAYGGVTAGPRYDAILHALFLGFVFAMIFGHAPVIFPAVLGLPIGYHPAAYLHLAVLHASLVLRIAGDLIGLPVWRQWGGMLNLVAILLFLGHTAWSAATAVGAQRAARPRG